MESYCYFLVLQIFTSFFKEIVENLALKFGVTNLKAINFSHTLLQMQNWNFHVNK